MWQNGKNGNRINMEFHIEYFSYYVQPHCSLQPKPLRVQFWRDGTTLALFLISLPYFTNDICLIVISFEIILQAFVSNAEIISIERKKRYYSANSTLLNSM